MLLQKQNFPLNDKNVLVDPRKKIRGKKKGRNNRSVIDLTYLLIPSGAIYYLSRTGLEIVRHHKCRPCLRITKGTSTLLKMEQRQRVGYKGYWLNLPLNFTWQPPLPLLLITDVSRRRNGCYIRNHEWN